MARLMQWRVIERVCGNVCADDSPPRQGDKWISCVVIEEREGAKFIGLRDKWGACWGNPFWIANRYLRLVEVKR